MIEISYKLLAFIFYALVCIFAIISCSYYEKDKNKKAGLFLVVAFFVFGIGTYIYSLDVRGKRREMLEEQEKLGVDDKGFYIKRIGKHDFIVNYGHEYETQPVHYPGCPCGWKGIVVSKDTYEHKDAVCECSKCCHKLHFGKR